MDEKKPVIVCTERRYVAFGYLAEYDRAGRVAVIEGARCAMYWGTTGGIHQLAETGPVKGKSRIGNRAPRIELLEVTAVIDVTEAAVKAWESA